MIYFDNAATTRQKPEEVYAAYEKYIREIGVSPGRGSYRLAIEASRMLFQSRKTVAQFFNCSDPSYVVFTKNSTEAINLFMKGYLSKGSHVLISPFEHNAVLRPIEELKKLGIIEYSVIPEEVIYNPENTLDKYINTNTKLLAITLASNLTGQLVFSKRIAEYAHKKGLEVFVDASQGAGKKIANMATDNIDFLAFTGHKDLLALPGVGGLISNKKIEIRPLIQGGMGIHGEEYVNPPIYPDCYEAGTINMPAIWSLKTSIDYINDNIEYIRNRENGLLNYFLYGMSKIDSVVIYNLNINRVPTFCFNIKGIKSSDVVEKLSRLDICVRGGIHCAIKAHETIGTVETGAVRVSLNAFNTYEEIDRFLEVIKEL